MKAWRVVAGVAAAATVATGCSSGSKNPAGAAAPTTSSVATPSPSPASGVPDVHGQLIQLGDLPAGWSAEKTSSSSVNSTAPKCFSQAKSFKNAEKARAEAAYRGGAQGVPNLQEEIVYLPGVAHQAMAQLAAEIEHCGTIAVSAGGTTLTGTVGPMAFPHFGDESVAFQVALGGRLNGYDVTLGLDFVAIRVGEEVALLEYGTAGTPDVATVQKYAQLAGSKLR